MLLQTEMEADEISGMDRWAFRQPSHPAMPRLRSTVLPSI